MARKKADNEISTAALTMDSADLLSNKSGHESTIAKAHAAKEGTTPEVLGRERIALLAYSYWEQRGYQGGNPEEDWYRAEREIGIVSKL